MKLDLKRIFSAICVLAGLGLICLGAKDGTWPGDAIQSTENITFISSESLVEGDDTEDVLADTILQFFTVQGGNAEKDITEEDQVQNCFYMEEEISPGQIFSFDCRMTEQKRGELVTDSTYEVAISVLGAEEPFQILEVYSAEREPFSFEDFNADGFQDLRVLYFYGANGGSADHYIWSPSRGEFIQGPEELSYFGMYGIDQEKRQLSMHYHGSAISGTEKLYQWSGEMDCELIRYFYHGEVFDYEDEEYTEKEYKGLKIDIRSYENGQEKILSDYLYPLEEYMERDAIWGIYCLDFVWEREVVLEGQESPCILRYAQEKEKSEEDAEEKYFDYLFLFREDTYLICALEKQESPAEYSDLIWEEAGLLTVNYEDGASHLYQWDGTELCFLSFYDD